MPDFVRFARGRAGDWEAICVDFDIAVQGRSLNEVLARLESAVSDYVAAAREKAPATCARLLSRRTPTGVSLLRSLRVLLSAWRHKTNGGDTSASFPVACPA
ncbi:MAG: hypothetical protein WBQ53_17675 [Methylocystis sp.]